MSMMISAVSLPSQRSSCVAPPLPRLLSSSTPFVSSAPLSSLRSAPPQLAAPAPWP
jgi:hypothetical protein